MQFNINKKIQEKILSHILITEHPHYSVDFFPEYLFLSGDPYRKNMNELKSYIAINKIASNNEITFTWQGKYCSESFFWEQVDLMLEDIYMESTL